MKTKTRWDLLTEERSPRRRARPRKLTKVMISACVARAYAARKNRKVDPDGDFDKAGRWYPSEIEDAEGDGTSVRYPSRAWPYSYMLRCRTRQHVRVLVERALLGEEVPSDVDAAVAEMQATLDAAGRAWDERRDDEVERLLTVLLARPEQTESESALQPKSPTRWDHLAADSTESLTHLGAS